MRTRPIARDAAARVTLALAFAYASVGVFWGMLAIAFADMLRANDLSSGAASAGLAFFSIAALGSMGLLRPRLRGAPRRAAMRGAITVFCAGCAVLVLVPQPALILGFTVTGIAAGVGDVAIHIAGNEHEERTGRSVLQWIHGGYSMGAVVGALVGGIGLHLGASYRTLLLCAAALPLLSLPGLRVVPSNGPAGADVAKHRRVRDRWMPPPGVLLPAVIAVSALLLEASLELWSAVYLRGTLNASILVGAAALAAFSLSLAIGRVFAAKVLFRLGHATTLLVSGFGSLGCTLAVGATTSPYLAGAALLLLGFFLSSAAPAAYGMLTGTPREQEAGVAWITAASYVGYGVGPPLLGALADVIGFPSTIMVLAFVSVPIAAAGLLSRGAAAKPIQTVEDVG